MSPPADNPSDELPILTDILVPGQRPTTMRTKTGSGGTIGGPVGGSAGGSVGGSVVTTHTASGAGIVGGTIGGTLGGTIGGSIGSSIGGSGGGPFGASGAAPSSIGLKSPRPASLQPAPLAPTSTVAPAEKPGAAANWATIEAEVYERVLKGLQGRIEGVIDQRLRDTVGQLVEQALSGLSTELKLSVRESLRDIVQRAVAHEISRIRTGKP